jgi:general secretion pathway protein J
MNTCAKSWSHGFTLVELLVALTILSLMIGMTFGSLRFGVRVADTVEWQVARSQTIHLVQRMLRRQLQQALPVPEPGGHEPGGLDFQATADRIEFVASKTVGTGYSGLYRIRIKVVDDFDRDIGSKKLVLSYKLLTPDDDARFPGYEFQDFTILDQFVGAEFAYLNDSGTGTNDWLHEWTDDRALPALIRLRIEHADSDGAVWPDLIIALKVTSLSALTES